MHQGKWWTGQACISEQQGKNYDGSVYWLGFIVKKFRRDAFLICFSIYCSAHVQKVQGLLKYMNTVRLGANRCGTNNFGWKQYNEQIRLKMAENPNANWADVDVELWLLYINPHNVDQSFTSNMIYKCYAFNYNDVCNEQNCTYSHCCIRCL